MKLSSSVAVLMPNSAQSGLCSSLKPCHPAFPACRRWNTPRYRGSPGFADSSKYSAIESFLHAGYAYDE